MVPHDKAQLKQKTSWNPNPFHFKFVNWTFISEGTVIPPLARRSAFESIKFRPTHELSLLGPHENFDRAVTLLQTSSFHVLNLTLKLL